MYFKFATLGFLAAVVMSAVSDTAAVDSSMASSAGAHNVAAAAVDQQTHTGLLTAAKRSYLSRKKVVSVLQRRNDSCDHKNHKTYRRGDEHKRPRLHRTQNHRCGGDLAHCDDNDSDEFEHHYEHDNDFDDDDFDFDFDDDEDFYDCDECDACDEDGFGYLNWEDYEDEMT